VDLGFSPLVFFGGNRPTSYVLLLIIVSRICYFCAAMTMTGTFELDDCSNSIQVQSDSERNDLGFALDELLASLLLKLFLRAFFLRMPPHINCTG
jgi:hypothetical protein